MSQNESIGLNLKPWPKLLDHYSPLDEQVLATAIGIVVGLICAIGLLKYRKTTP